MKKKRKSLYLYVVSEDILIFRTLGPLASFNSEGRPSRAEPLRLSSEPLFHFPSCDPSRQFTPIDGFDFSLYAAPIAQLTPRAGRGRAEREKQKRRQK